MRSADNSRINRRSDLCCIHDSAIRKNCRTVNHVPKLADVSRPVMIAERSERSGSDFDRGRHLQLRQEVRDQLLYVVDSIAQWRQSDNDARQSLDEVSAQESARLAFD